MSEHDELTGANGRLIKNMRPEDRPREKALRLGLKALSDAELMALLFSTGIKGKSVIEMSQDILDDNKGHLSTVASLSVSDFLKRYKGIGVAKAITLLAALELGARSSADAAAKEEPTVNSSEIAYRLMRHHLADLPHEEFWVMLLSQSGKVLREVKIGQGGLTGTVADVKLIIRAAVDHLASAMILFHNHPSGNLRPSPQDDALTKKISEAAKLIDTRVNDHIIVSANGYYSYNDEGRM